MNVDDQRLVICEIGDRLYRRGFAAANDGNISVRQSDDQFLCTPTMQCKGFLKPADLCMVDLQGRRIGGTKKPSSEIRLHLEIYKARPDVNSVVHCHPPHATAFAVAHEPILRGVLPEAEIFLGEVPIAPYETPGTQEFAETLLPFVQQTNVIVLANHGTVSFGENLERAYWWTEILDAYCRILILARGLGNVQQLPADKVQELRELRIRWGAAPPAVTDS